MPSFNPPSPVAGLPPVSEQPHNPAYVRPHTFVKLRPTPKRAFIPLASLLGKKTVIDNCNAIDSPDDMNGNDEDDGMNGVPLTSLLGKRVPGGSPDLSSANSVNGEDDKMDGSGSNDKSSSKMKRPKIVIKGTVRGAVKSAAKAVGKKS